jgi:hypothetical protein
MNTRARCKLHCDNKGMLQPRRARVLAWYDQIKSEWLLPVEIKRAEDGRHMRPQVI